MLQKYKPWKWKEEHVNGLVITFYWCWICYIAWSSWEKRNAQILQQQRDYIRYKFHLISFKIWEFVLLDIVLCGLDIGIKPQLIDAHDWKKMKMMEEEKERG